MKVAIHIITFRRADGLRKLLDGLTRLTFHHTAPELTIILVDNDGMGSARPVADAFLSPLNLHYFIEPQQGIPLARNRALEATPPDADFIALIDDDEVPEPAWLDELLCMQGQTQAPCVRGPVMPEFPDSAPAWIIRGGFFNRPDYPDGQVIMQGAANNTLVSFPAVQGRRFDARMRFSGGSDHLFFKAAGLRTVWAARAIVHESNPASRTRLKWLVRRHYRLGNTLALAERLMGAPPPVRLLRLGKALVRMGIGFCEAMLFVRHGRAALARGLLSVARGLGMLAGLLGVRAREYYPNRL